LSGDGAFREKWNDEIKAPGTWKALYGEVFVFEYPSGEKFSVNVADGAKIFVRNDAKVWHRAEKQVVASTGDIIPLSSYLGFTYDQLVQATRERFRDHRWKEHDARLAELALHIILKKRLSTDPFMFSVEFQQKVLPYALAQLTFIRRLGLDGIKALSADDRASNMAWQLFTNFPLLEKFANALAPEDNVANAINIWAVLTRDQPPGERAAFENLTIALALIYDTPGAGRQNTRSFIRNTESGSDEAAKAFAYFREKQKKGTLYLKCDEILPDELIWAVSPEKFSFAEYEWALSPYRWKIKPVEGVKFRDSKTRAESEALLQNFLRIGDRYERIAGAYNLIRYEANKPYPQYTMENILRLGGTCSNQTDFSVAFARAHGVPAGGIAGEEPNGINHNWTLFRGKNGWRTTGRGNSDYGISLSPQTGRSLPEVSFYLYDDLNRKNGKRDIALRLVRAAQLLEHANAHSGRMKLLEAAVRGCPGQLVFWEEWFTALAASEEKIPVNQLTPILRRYRDQFKKFPDFYFENAVRDVEVRQLFSQWSDTQIVSFMRKQRQQMSKEYPNRFDLILVSLQYETEQLLKLKLSGQVKILLETAVDDYGKGSFREYDRLLDTIIGIAQRNKDFPAARSVLVRLMSAFEKHHYKGRRDVQRLDTATLNLASARMNREKRIFEKLAAEFARIETENPRVHAENRAKEIGKDMEGVAKTMEKIKTKMTKTDG
ncbi:MAG: hypothetical protein LBV54_06410, partial [Puniceicoccales bacterium]|nr:hypothetical protein [Puniceicoccales bacterium]